MDDAYKRRLGRKRQWLLRREGSGFFDGMVVDDVCLMGVSWGFLDKGTFWRLEIEL